MPPYPTGFNKPKFGGLKDLSLCVVCFFIRSHYKPCQYTEIECHSFFVFRIGSCTIGPRGPKVGMGPSFGMGLFCGMGQVIAGWGLIHGLKGHFGVKEIPNKKKVTKGCLRSDLGRLWRWESRPPSAKSIRRNNFCFDFLPKSDGFLC